MQPIFILWSGPGGGKPSQHQLSDRLQVSSLHPQGELLLLDPPGPQQGCLTGIYIYTHTHTHTHTHSLLHSLFNGGVCQLTFCVKGTNTEWGSFLLFV